MSDERVRDYLQRLLAGAIVVAAVALSAYQIAAAVRTAPERAVLVAAENSGVGF